MIEKKNFKKKLLSAGLILSLVLSMCACTSADAAQISSKSTKTTKLVFSKGTTKVKPAAGDCSNDKIGKTREPGCPTGWEDCAISFSTELFRRTYPQSGDASEKSFVMSPASVLTAMLMVEEGADGKTAAQIEDAVGTELLYARESLAEILNHKGKSTNVRTANSIWYRDTDKLEVKNDYVLAAQKFFNADIYKAAFNTKTAGDINKWCKFKTKNRIKTIIGKNSIKKESMMYLINALTFDGKWKRKYESNDVRKADFTTESGRIQKADMMYDTENLYLENSNATGFVKPYKGGYSFVALLPKDGMKMTDFVKTLDGESFAKLLADKKKEPVRTGLPKFKNQCSMNLEESLKSMGITDLFDQDAADLNAMASYKDGNLYVSQVKHKTFIETDTEGTRAAAVTSVETMYSTSLVEKQVFLNRPFFYAIVDDETGIPVFIGVVMEL